MSSRFIQLLLFFHSVKLIRAQYEPQSNIDRVAQRPLLRPCPREWEWPCNNGECIAHYDVCDGIPQCTDGSDEWGCNENTNRNVKAHEGNAKEPPVIASTAAGSISSTTVAASSLKGTVTIQYTHILIALLAFVILSFFIITVVKRRARKKSSGFRNRRGNILQQDSDEDDILISSMYS